VADLDAFCSYCRHYPSRELEIDLNRSTSMKLRLLRNTRPDIIVIHPCGALWEGEPIAMDAEQAVAVCNAAPEAVVVATHLDSLDHATVSRANLRQHALARGISSAQLRIPDDGQTLAFIPATAVRRAAEG
jgi:L-ascorbate metabolism protein UlaG (beta-lactamase superfamily)